MAKRSTKLCDNGAQRRFDQVLLEAFGESTNWISAQSWNDLILTAHAGELVETIFPATKCCQTPNPRSKLVPTPKSPLTMCLVLEHKLGGCDDDTAIEVQRFDLDGSPAAGSVNLRTQEHGCGFYRLRALDGADPTSTAALAPTAIVSIKRVNHRDF